MKSHIACLIITFIFTGCSSHMIGLKQEKYDYSIVLNDLRDEISDLKHSLNNTQVELQILDEQVKNQEQALKKNKNAYPHSDSGNNTVNLEKKVLSHEKQQTKMVTETKQLLSHANQTSDCLEEYSKKIAELEILLQHQKQTVAHPQQNRGAAKNIYIVKPGDSLEKISRNHKITVNSLKEENNLTQNKIIIGQELKIPSLD